VSDIQAAPGLDITGPLTDTLRAILLFLPKFAAFVAIVVVGWVASRLIKMAVRRALVRLGFGVRYVPDAAVMHVIPPERLTRASFLRRRFWFGAALGMRGGRGRALAASQALASATGAATAAVTGQEALAMERAVRAAENAGALYASTRPRRIA